MHKTEGGAYQFQVGDGLLTGKIMGKKMMEITHSYYTSLNLTWFFNSHTVKIILHNYRSLKGNFGQSTPRVTFVQAKRREVKYGKRIKTGLQEADYQKAANGSPEIKKVTSFNQLPCTCIT